MIRDTLVALLGDYAAHIDPAAPTPRAQRVYDELPELYRRADDGTLFALVVALTDVLGTLEVLVDAIDHRATDEGGAGTFPESASILTDPDRTPWPAWLAQAVGVDLARAGITDPTADRAATADAIRVPVNGWRAGSRAAIETAARRTLTGARTVVVRPGLDPDPFVLTVSTAVDETPSSTALRAAIEPILPAGVVLALDNNVGNWRGREAPGSWGARETLAPTWADVEQLYEPEP